MSQYITSTLRAGTDRAIHSSLKISQYIVDDYVPKLGGYASVQGEQCCGPDSRDHHLSRIATPHLRFIVVVCTLNANFCSLMLAAARKTDPASFPKAAACRVFSAHLARHLSLRSRVQLPKIWLRSL